MRIRETIWEEGMYTRKQTPRLQKGREKHKDWAEVTSEMATVIPSVFISTRLLCEDKERVAQPPILSDIP